MTASRVAAAVRSLAIVCVLASMACASAQPRTVDDAVSLTQRVGAELPLDSRWVEADGRRVALGELFADGKPVLLVLGYYTCPQLCGLLMHGVLEAVHTAGSRAADVRIVAISIDPDDTPATASARRDTDLAYAEFLSQAIDAVRPLPELHLLTGDPIGIGRVNAAAGYRVRRSADPARDTGARYAHPAALVIATPRGRISRYLMGVRFDAAELGAAIADARDEGTGALTDRIALLCAHLDLALGRHSAAVLQATRAVAVLIALVLAAWCWRRRGDATRGNVR
jgi:protein SCO1